MGTRRASPQAGAPSLGVALISRDQLVVVECRLCSLEVDSQEGRSGWVRVKGGLVVGAGLGLGDR